MKRISIALCLGLSLGACGAASAPRRAPDEVTATWTTGDDAPLGDPGQSSRDDDGDQPGGPKT